MEIAPTEKHRGDPIEIPLVLPLDVGRYGTGLIGCGVRAGAYAHFMTCKKYHEKYET